FIAYATGAGETAFDGEGTNSPFTAALLEEIESEGVSIGDIMVRVNGKVKVRTQGVQQAGYHSALNEQFFFRPKVAPPPEPVLPQPTEIEFALWQATKDSTQAGAFEDFLKKFPDGVFARVARQRAKALINNLDTGELRSLFSRYADSKRIRSRLSRLE